MHAAEQNCVMMPNVQIHLLTGRFLQVLKEETESAGLPLPPDITEQQLEQW